MVGHFKQGAGLMKAVIYEAFGVPPQLDNVPDPTPEVHGVVVKVMAKVALTFRWMLSDIPLPVPTPSAICASEGSTFKSD